MDRFTCCITGYKNIPMAKLEYVKEALTKEILEAIEDGYFHFISGFAQGIELLSAEIVVDFKKTYPSLKLEAAIPYRNRLKTTNKLFRRLINECSAIGVLSEEYTPTCYMNRNRMMISHSQRVIVVYDGRARDGTLFTIRYACAYQKEVRLIRI